MFDVGFWELAILFGLGLIILGPERLPKVAMQIGNWVGRARRMARQLSEQFREEIIDLDSNDPFSSSGNTNRTTPGYKRPGVDDLKPSASGHDSSPESGSVEPESSEKKSAAHSADVADKTTDNAG